MFRSGKGIFTFLPLGQRVLNKLTRIIESELRQIGAQKCYLPLIGFDSIWEKSKRWDVYGSSLFRFEDRLGNKACLQPTCEEMITDLAAQFGVFKDASLPMMLFQSADKFRDEMNPRFGLLRSRQFIMNDLYSFDESADSAVQTYQLISDVYKRIFFERLDLQETLIVEAVAAEMKGSKSHEFHLPNESAEDRVLHCQQCKATFQTELTSSGTCSNCKEALKPVISIEIAHTFQLGQHYSSIFGAVNAKRTPYFMCSFGIGISRLIAASIDTLTPSLKAMRLPKSISPYKLAVVFPKVDETHHAARFAHELTRQLDTLPNLHNDVLADDRTAKSIGRRLVELNQLGIPSIVVVPSQKSAQPHDLVEMELYRAEPKNEELQLVGLFTHKKLFDLLKTL